MDYQKKLQTLVGLAIKMGFQCSFENYKSKERKQKDKISWRSFKDDRLIIALVLYAKYNIVLLVAFV